MSLRATASTRLCMLISSLQASRMASINFFFTSRDEEPPPSSSSSSLADDVHESISSATRSGVTSFSSSVEIASSIGSMSNKES